MNYRLAVLGWVLVAPFTALAADPKTVEELAVVRDAEVARLDRLSMRKSGDDARFDIDVAWRDPAQRPEGEPATRVIRYAAKCKDLTLALASISTSDPQGRPLKIYLVPPGTAEFSRPADGSREAGWI
ncbi:unnamed protein product, partial [Phaeothamnion confervicola]